MKFSEVLNDYLELRSLEDKTIGKLPAFVSLGHNTKSYYKALQVLEDKLDEIVKVKNTNDNNTNLLKI